MSQLYELYIKFSTGQYVLYNHVSFVYIDGHITSMPEYIVQYFYPFLDKVKFAYKKYKTDDVIIDFYY